MDDRDLEARLSAHLHRRFDDAHPPTELAPSIRQAFATQPRGLSVGALSVRSPMRLGFSLTAAAVAVVVLAVAGSNLGFHLGVAGRPTPSPTPITGPAQRFFIILPPSATLPSKAESSVASDVLTARLTALGVGNFITATGYGITFTLPVAGPSDDDIRAVLAAPGVVQFVPIPAADPMVSAGQTLPHPYPVLFGSDGVASVRDGTDQNGNPALNIDLAPAASRLFADYTTNHIANQVAIVVDGTVASAPVIQSAIVGGSVQISHASSSAGFAIGAQLRAILIGGALPASWRGAPVPRTISVERAITAALAQASAVDDTGTAGTPQLDVELVRGQWQAVWTVPVSGLFPYTCNEGPCPSPRHTTAIVKLDALSGAPISLEVGR